MMKPGGHGAIWKLMHDEGVFDWLQASGAKPAALETKQQTRPCPARPWERPSKRRPL